MTDSTITTIAADGSHIEKLYEFGERLSESKDKSQVNPRVLFLFIYLFLNFLSFKSFYNYVILTCFFFSCLIIVECEGLPGDYGCS
jgi:hypothetical protein